MSRSIVETTLIEAPIERIWAELIDLERWPEWTASTTSVERLDDGPLAVGSRARARQPRLPGADYVVTELVAPRCFVWVNKARGVTGTASHTLTPEGTGHRLTLRVDFAGPLAAVVKAVAGRLTRRYVVMEARGLKHRAEAAGDG